MNSFFKFFSALFILLVTSLLLSFDNNEKDGSVRFPYKQAGLTDRQAAAHLLSRFTFGAKPGQIDEVLATGLEKWFVQQLNAQLADEELNARLKGYDALQMSNAEIVNAFVKPGQILRSAAKDGAVNKDSIDKGNKASYKDVLMAYMQQNGLRPQKELYRQLANQKILRAAYSNNQLQEVLTDFWFNHFNVSVTKNACAEYILSFERDVIRPNGIKKFQDLLLATAKSPAMLVYLDNFNSAGTDSSTQMFGNGRLASRFEKQLQNNPGNSAAVKFADELKKRKKMQGLNENYAREVMELHTLGVDGGYSQSDVTQAARVLTGWTVYPVSDYGTGNVVRKMIDKIGEKRLLERGFIHEGDFLFAANRHDNGEKVVLGKTYKPAGYDEGVQLLQMLAHHTSTAKFISKKIAVRFVSDNPPASLVNKMANTFLAKDGDIKQVLLAMVSAPEFWSKEAIAEKTKSPFELAISTVRSLDADVKMPYQLYTWIDKMGQKMYYYQAPTGFPDKAQYWINTGALLNRMNFGLAIASQRIPGVKIDLLMLNQRHEPESAEAALQIFGKMMMPERDLKGSIKRLTPLLHDPALQQKIETKANKQSLSQKTVGEDEEMDEMKANEVKNQKQAEKLIATSPDKAAGNMLAQVVGIIVGSPEFQRR